MLVFSAYLEKYIHISPPTLPRLDMTQGRYNVGSTINKLHFFVGSGQIFISFGSSKKLKKNKYLQLFLFRRISFLNQLLKQKLKHNKNIIYLKNDWIKIFFWLLFFLIDFILLFMLLLSKIRCRIFWVQLLK